MEFLPENKWYEPYHNTYNFIIEKQEKMDDKEEASFNTQLMIQNNIESAKKIIGVHAY